MLLLAKLPQYHIFLWLFQTHPSRSPNQCKSSLLNVALEDLIKYNSNYTNNTNDVKLSCSFSLKKSIQNVFENLFTNREIFRYRLYLKSAATVCQLENHQGFKRQTSIKNTSNDSLQQLDELRIQMIELYVLNQEFLMQDFLLYLTKQIILLQQLEHPPQHKKQQSLSSISSSSSSLITQVNNSQQKDSEMLTILYHLEFTDQGKRNSRELKLDLEALEFIIWNSLIETLKTRIFKQNDVASILESNCGTCTNGQEIQWYIEFKAPAARFDSIKYFNHGILHKIPWIEANVIVEFIFVCIRTQWI